MGQMFGFREGRPYAVHRVFKDPFEIDAGGIAVLEKRAVMGGENEFFFWHSGKFLVKIGDRLRRLCNLYVANIGNLLVSRWPKQKFFWKAAPATKSGVQERASQHGRKERRGGSESAGPV
jgi:hypothetical protein